MVENSVVTLTYDTKRILSGIKRKWTRISLLVDVLDALLLFYFRKEYVSLLLCLSIVRLLRYFLSKIKDELYWQLIVQKVNVIHILIPPLPPLTPLLVLLILSLFPKISSRYECRCIAILLIRRSFSWLVVVRKTTARWRYNHRYFENISTRPTNVE